MPDGDPEGVRLIDRMNWTGIGLAFPRVKWPEIKQRSEFSARASTSSSVTRKRMTTCPTIYIGQSDELRNRIHSHVQNKDFWDWGVVFVSTSGGLNRAHVTWLEYALVNRAVQTKRCHLDNGNAPQEPAMTEAEKADTQGFLKESFKSSRLSDFARSSLPNPSRRPRPQQPILRSNLTRTSLIR